MAITLQPAVEGDVHRIIELERRAYAESPLTPILFPGPFPPEVTDKRAEEMVSQLRQNPTVRWIKAVDTATDTNELVAFAKWAIIETPDQRQPDPNRSFGPGCNIEACEQLFGDIHRKRTELMAGKAHVVLYTLQTDPKYQRRGAGSLLLRWGLDIADDRRLPAYLESSPAAHSLYRKHGFRDLGQIQLDPKWKQQYGSADPNIYFMLREVQSQ